MARRKTKKKTAKKTTAKKKATKKTSKKAASKRVAKKKVTKKVAKKKTAKKVAKKKTAKKTAAKKTASRKKSKAKKKKKKQIADLTDGQVRAIRKKYDKGKMSQRELGEAYGLGTHQIGRVTRGEARSDSGGPISSRGRTKLTSRQVATLRRRYAKGVASQATLAREYGVSAAAVSRLVRGCTYDGVGGPRVEKGGMPHGRKLTPKQILEVAKSDENMSELARKFGVTRQAIQALRKRWTARLDELE